MTKNEINLTVSVNGTPTIVGIDNLLTAVAKALTLSIHQPADRVTVVDDDGSVLATLVGGKKARRARAPKNLGDQLAAAVLGSKGGAAKSPAKAAAAKVNGAKGGRPIAYRVVDYTTGEDLPGTASLLLRTASREAGETGAVWADRDKNGVWQYLGDGGADLTGHENARIVWVWGV